MSKLRKKSLAERVRQKRLASVPPAAQESLASQSDPIAADRPSAGDTLPSPRSALKLELVLEAAESESDGARPLPQVAAAQPSTAASRDADPEPGEAEPAASASSRARRLDVPQSIAPVTAMPEVPAAAPSKRRIALLAAVAVVAGVAIGVRIMRPKVARGVPATQTAAAQQPAPPPVEAFAPPPPPPAPPGETSEPSPAASVATRDERATSAVALRDRALELLKKSKNSEAMEAASAALDADPTDAMPYLVLGSALQDAGHWKEAHRAYELCVKNATKGLVGECHAMLRSR